MTIIPLLDTPAPRPASPWATRTLTRLAREKPRPDDRIFFLLYPPRPMAERIHRIAVRLCERLDLPGRPTNLELLHVSLLRYCVFAEMTSARLDAVAEALTDLEMPRFLTSLDRIVSFGRGAGPLVLCGDDGVVGIRVLQQELTDAMSRIVLPAPKRSYTPHVTLNYRNCSVPEQVVEDICWAVTELVLVCSLRGRRRHVELGRWPLACQPTMTN